MNFEAEVAMVTGRAKPARGRSCGGCTLCCRLVPVEKLGKGAGECCRYQTAGGCSVYPALAMVSEACHRWNCRWLVDADTRHMERPDRAHYVVDVMPDYVRITNAEGVSQEVVVVQIWVDPAFPDAHRDPALRAWLERRYAERGEAALIRYDQSRSIALFPPASAEDGQWHEVGGNADPSMGGLVDRLAGFRRGS